MDLQKVQMKVARGDKNDWVHFCYVPTHIKQKFDRFVNSLGLPSNNWVVKWAAEDFKMIDVFTTEDLEGLKTQIRTMYQELYPELYLDSPTDNQGWLRVWYTKHMEKELSDIGR